MPSTSMVAKNMYLCRSLDLMTSDLASNGTRHLHDKRAYMEAEYTHTQTHESDLKYFHLGKAFIFPDFLSYYAHEKFCVCACLCSSVCV